MKRLINPERGQWLKLSQRPQFKAEQIRTQVQDIMAKVVAQGDTALYEYNRLFDNYQGHLKLSESEKKGASDLVAEPLKAAIKLAYRNIYSFHQAQQRNAEKIETCPGVSCWREARPIEKVGLYIPGGSAPLFSTVLMLGIPAQIAAVPQRILCSPADKNGNLNPAIIYAAQLCGINEIYKLGGAQAIAALSFGTETIPKVDKLFGPGNAYVTAAKQEALNFGLAIDMPAGPSEVLVIADAEAKPDFVAADLLSQAEHGADSQLVLCTNSQELIEAVSLEIKEQLQSLSRASIAQKALENSLAISFDTLCDCVAFSNVYAPEHLIINCLEAKSLLPEIQNAGSVFVGPYSAESIGDYASGTNHTLPTAAYARSYSGLSLDSFQKQISFQEVSAEGLRNIGPAVALMAQAEELSAHKRAVDIRLESLKTASDGV
jgi:histidinol dehydrogenase